MKINSQITVSCIQFIGNNYTQLIFFIFAHKARGHELWRFAGAFTVVKRQSESKNSVANAGAKPAKCTACPDLSGSASQ